VASDCSTTSRPLGIGTPASIAAGEVANSADGHTRIREGLVAVPKERLAGGHGPSGRTRRRDGIEGRGCSVRWRQDHSSVFARDPGGPQRRLK
jgi:hypothetical protein